MSVSKITDQQLLAARDALSESNFNKFFVDGLGWEQPSLSEETASIEEKKFSYSYVAELAGVQILHFSCKSKLPSIKEKQLIHKKIALKHSKHLCIFSTENHSSWSYLQNKQFKEFYFFKDQNEDSFMSKLVNLYFSIDDSPKISDLSQRLSKAFDPEKVTKKFFEDFQTNLFSFQEYIKGINNTEDKKWYSSIILNRLMFIWFVQKKGFLDQKDYDYLENKLEDSKLRGKDCYYSEFLNLLFFEGLAKHPKDRSEKAKKLLGEIKYLNGGLFTPHEIEEKYKNKIKIPDIAFAKTFELFNQYEWYGEDVKKIQSTEQKGAISPDILGYIFEKYINTQQKSAGAYYTKDEITDYLNREAIHSSILTKVNKKTGKSYKDLSEVLSSLDVKLCKVLLTNPDSILNTLTVLDPAVGSGAFLISAMKTLLDIYSPVIARVKNLSSNEELKKWHDDFTGKHKSTVYGIKKHIILKNLYGVDLMKEATEVCKLRLFLSLVSCVLDKSELEPLPNIDFNIMSGNSLVGFLKKDSLHEQYSLFGESYEQNIQKYNKAVAKYKNEALSFEKLKELKKSTLQFLKSSSNKLNQVIAQECQEKGVKYTELNKNKETLKTRSPRKEDIGALSAFQWDFVFNSIIKIDGGFDVIITNPPWDKAQLSDKELLKQYNSKIKKNTTSKKKLDEIKKGLLKDSDIEQNYISTNEGYKFLSDYVDHFYSNQSGKIIESNKVKKSSSHTEFYRLFTERCFNLLKDDGEMAIVIPSGIYKDDGSKGLRDLLFSRANIKGLIDFPNQGKDGKFFEGVHPSFKFSLLTLKKEKPTGSFPCLFVQKDLNILNHFPEGAMTYTIKEIKEMSPRDHQIIEFQSKEDKEIFKKLSKFPALGDKIENTWNLAIYNGELNETSSNHLFENKKNLGTLPLYKGGAIHQYKYDFDLSKTNRFVNINADKVKNGKGFAFKNQMYKSYRLVIRTIARNTDERSLITAIIPKNCFITNSLHGVSIESKSPSMNNQYMLLLQSFLNSFVADFMLRKKVSSNINIKFLSPLSIPRLTEKTHTFKELVKRSALLTCTDKKFSSLAKETGVQVGGVKDSEQRLKIQGEIDAIVAYVYGLTFDEFKYVLNTFNTGKEKERLNKLKQYALEAYNTNHFIKKAA